MQRLHLERWRRYLERNGRVSTLKRRPSIKPWPIKTRYPPLTEYPLCSVRDSLGVPQIRYQEEKAKYEAAMSTEAAAPGDKTA